MSRWSDLFSALSRGVTDGDTSRHTEELTKESDRISHSVCHDLSPSVKGIDTEKQPTKKPNGKVETTSWLPLGTQFTKSLTDGDASRDIEGTSSGAPSDLSRCVTVCQSSLFIDFETRNAGGCKLNIAGAWCYADNPRTEILTLVYRDADKKSWLWVPANGLRTRLITFAADPAVAFVCFGDFEIAVWDRIMVPRFGFPEIPISRWVNAQAACSHLALPRTSAKCCRSSARRRSRTMLGDAWY